MPDFEHFDKKFEEDLHEFENFDEKKFEKKYEKDFEKKDLDKNFKKHEEKICIKVPKVVGRNDTQILVEAVIPFPKEYPAVAIKDIQKEIRDLKIFVCKDKVLINGILHKNINYKTFEDELEKECKGQYIDAYYGNVMHVGVNLEFAGFIEVPGARKGDDFQVEFAGVEDCCEVDILEEPELISKKHTLVVYKSLREKVIIKIDIKVLRDVQITVKPEECNICP